MDAAWHSADGAALCVHGDLFPVAVAEGLAIDRARAAHIHDELRKLGPISTGQRNTLVAFGVTVGLWLLPGLIAVAVRRQRIR